MPDNGGRNARPRKASTFGTAASWVMVAAGAVLLVLLVTDPFHHLIRTPNPVTKAQNAQDNLQAWAAARLPSCDDDGTIDMVKSIQNGPWRALAVQDIRPVYATSPGANVWMQECDAKFIVDPAPTRGWHKDRDPWRNGTVRVVACLTPGQPRSYLLSVHPYYGADQRRLTFESSDKPAECPEEG